MSIKKILSLIGATVITTSGVAPLMAMMPNNKNLNFFKGESSSSFTGGEDKILKDIIYENKETKEHFFAEWIIFLSSTTIENLNKFLINKRVPDFNTKIINMINFLKLRLKEINGDNELSFISKIEGNEGFYSNFLTTVCQIFANPLVKSDNGVMFTIDDFGNFINLFKQ
ncbi:hypothetical protein [Spiroplasma citri]|uniref:Hypothetical transmembrane protein n=1 Tax=Spiroplasma citri TaxID=2133 RepID=Q14KK6_SPICI|nr:hypothetical protein [Spiroplasma citri]APE75280.1 hypothetical protein SCITRI_001405 [Spiroplasma citri]QED25172.1 hypothetical protein FRX96_07315 [Spiroplasma citri]QIA67532.1 hypothetical protein GMI18_07825 [Spiroplasma citri]QIA69388.1 hypothetical protein GL298_07785 [Spiroplasma citri]QIA71253.1 hypothetical protein GL981_07830 [Spiroplasma citri]